MPCIAWVLLIKSVSGKRIARVENINHFAIKFQFVGEFYSKEYATVRRGFFFGLQQVSIWFSLVRICPLKRWSYFVFPFCIAFEAMR